MVIRLHKDFIDWKDFKVGTVIYGVALNLEMKGSTNSISTPRFATDPVSERMFALPVSDSPGTFPKTLAPWGSSPSKLETFRTKDSPFVVIRIWLGHSIPPPAWLGATIVSSDTKGFDFSSLSYKQTASYEESDFVALELLGPTGRIYQVKQERDVTRNLLMWLPYSPSTDFEVGKYEPENGWATNKISLY